MVLFFTSAGKFVLDQNLESHWHQGFSRNPTGHHLHGKRQGREWVSWAIYVILFNQLGLKMRSLSNMHGHKMSGSMWISYLLLMFTCACPRGWYGIPSLPPYWQIAPNWSRQTRSKVSSGHYGHRPKAKVVLPGNKKDDLTIIYTPADNLKVHRNADHLPSWWCLRSVVRKQETWQ